MPSSLEAEVIADVMCSEFGLEQSGLQRGPGEIKQGNPAIPVQVFDMGSESVERQMKPRFAGSFIFTKANDLFSD